ncbi:capsular biosynthesis protein [Cupriavidus sp. AU9028]|nr:capsular biosynthesis protein [Cupriavidus sp. AU9028]
MGAGRQPVGKWGSVPATPGETRRVNTPVVADRGLVERASLDQLMRHSRLLFLQGPNGPFFSRLRDALERADRKVWKVNFNGGDDLFFRGANVIRFARPMPEWEAFLHDLVQRLGIQAIVVFGSARRHHRIAERLALSLGLAFWVFEEGYLRPDYVTLERGGVNAASPLAAVDLDEMPLIPAEPKGRTFSHAFGRMAWYSFCYFLIGLALQHRYPDYRHHKPFHLREVGFWLRAAYRKRLYRKLERPIVRQLLSDGHAPFYLVALQVHNDSQIRLYSPWRRIEDFIEWTVHSFAHHAPDGTMLVIKHHPMDRGHRDYTEVIRAAAYRYEVEDRVVYVHDAHLPSLLQRCDGVVTINSTTGLQALYHRVPVIVLGRCFYDKAGLTYQGSLDSFWKHPPPVDVPAFRRFRNYLIHASQINSSFYADERVGRAGQRAGWYRRWPARVACFSALLAVDPHWFPQIEVSRILSLVQPAYAWLAG